MTCCSVGHCVDAGMWVCFWFCILSWTRLTYIRIYQDPKSSSLNQAGETNVSFCASSSLQCLRQCYFSHHSFGHKSLRGLQHTLIEINSFLSFGFLFTSTYILLIFFTFFPSAVVIPALATFKIIINKQKKCSFHFTHSFLFFSLSTKFIHRSFQHSSFLSLEFCIQLFHHAFILQHQVNFKFCCT